MIFTPLVSKLQISSTIVLGFDLWSSCFLQINSRNDPNNNI